MLQKKDINALLLTSLLLLYIIIDFFLRSTTFLLSSSFTLFLQSNLSSPFFPYFFRFFCDLLSTPVAGALIFLFYSLSHHKIRAISFLLFFFVNTYLLAVLKIIYNDPRPYFEDNLIEAMECYTENGNPSGHSLFSVLFFGFVWKEGIWWRRKEGEERNDCEERRVLISREERKKKNVRNNVIFVVGTIVIGLTIFFILLGRVYLGMHSLNEVCLGAILGAYMLYMYIQYIEDLIFKLIKKMVEKNIKEIKCEQHYLSYSVLIKIFIVYIAFLVFAAILFEITKATFIIPEQWENNTKRFCPTKTLQKKYFYKCFADSGGIGAVFGLFLGILFTKEQYNFSIEKKNQNYQKQNKTICFLFSRTLLIFITMAGIAGAFKFISFGSDIYIKWIVNNNLGLLFSSIALIKLLPYVFWKLKLESSEDFIRYNNGDIKLLDENNEEEKFFELTEH